MYLYNDTPQNITVSGNGFQTYVYEYNPDDHKTFNSSINIEMIGYSLNLIEICDFNGNLINSFEFEVILKFENTRKFIISNKGKTHYR